MFRLLLDPAPSEGNGQPTPEAPPAPKVEVPKPATMELPADEVARIYRENEELRTFRAQAEADKKAALDAKENERLKAVAEKDGLDKALADHRVKTDQEIAAAKDRYANLERSLLGSEAAKVVAEGMVGTTFVSDFAANSVRADILASVESSRDDAGNVVLRDKQTKQFVSAETVKRALAGDKYSAVIAASKTTGGTGAKGSDVRADEPPPATTGDLLLDAVKARLGGVKPGKRSSYTPLASVHRN